MVSTRQFLTAYWKTSSPVLLVRTGTLTEEEVGAIREASSVHRVVLLGGTAAVSDEVMTQLGDGYEYVRLGGADRLETSALVASWSCEHGLSWVHPFVATGTGFADALAGSAVAGAMSSPVLLADGEGTKAAHVLKEHRHSVESVYLLGGEAAVGSTAERALAAALD